MLSFLFIFLPFGAKNVLRSNPNITAIDFICYLLSFLFFLSNFLLWYSLLASGSITIAPIANTNTILCRCHTSSSFIYFVRFYFVIKIENGIWKVIGKNIFFSLFGFFILDKKWEMHCILLYVFSNLVFTPLHWVRVSILLSDSDTFVRCSYT